MRMTLGQLKALAAACKCDDSTVIVLEGRHPQFRDAHALVSDAVLTPEGTIEQPETSDTVSRPIRVLLVR